MHNHYRTANRDSRSPLKEALLRRARQAAIACAPVAMSVVVSCGHPDATHATAAEVVKRQSAKLSGYVPVTNLGSQLGQSVATAINNQGVVVGNDTEGSTSASIGVNPGGFAKGFRWTEAEGMTYLPSDGSGTYPTGINDNGVIAGSHVTAAGWISAGRFNPSTDAVFHSINGAGGGAGINQAGTMTGHGYFPTGHVMFRADDASNQVIPLPPGYYYTQGRTIDDNGTVVGRGVLNEGGSRALRYSDAAGMEDLSALNNVSTQGGPWTLYDAFGTNGTAIVGWGLHDGKQTAFRFVPGADGGPNAITDLGMPATFPGDNYVNTSIALGVNAHGDIVGAVYDHWPNWPYDAWVWIEGTGMIDLNSLIDPQSGWKLTAAYAINDNRVVVGWGYLNGLARAFLMRIPDLSPCPPSPDGCRSPGVRNANGDCSAGDAVADGTACQPATSCAQPATCSAGTCACPPRSGRIEAETFDAISGGQNTGTVVQGLSGGAWLLYRAVNFGTSGQFNRIRFNLLSPIGVDEVSVHLDSLTGPIAADLKTIPTGTGYIIESAALSPSTTGVHDTYVVVSGDEGAGLDWFELYKGASRHTVVSQAPRLAPDAGFPDLSSTPGEEQDDAPNNAVWANLPQNVQIPAHSADGVALTIQKSATMMAQVRWKGGAGPVAITLFDQGQNLIAPAVAHAFPADNKFMAEWVSLAPQQLNVVVRNDGDAAVTVDVLVGFVPAP